MQNSAISLLSELRGAGFNLTLENGTVLVSPASKLTDSERQLIRSNKKELVQALSEPQVDIGTIRPPGLTGRFLAASLALDRQIADQDLQQREGMARAATAEVLSLFTRSKSAPTDPRQFNSAPIPAPRPAPAKPPRPQVGDAAWQLREGAHRRYQAHHWGCLTCIGAGQGRGDKCSTGAALWSIYETAIKGEKA
jgi:hypothetical protein